MLYPFELRAHENEFNTVKRAYCETRAALARLGESRKRRYLERNWIVTLSPMGSDFASSLESGIVISRTSRSIFSAGSSVNTLFFPMTVEILCTSPLEHGPSLSVQEQELLRDVCISAQRPDHRDLRARLCSAACSRKGFGMPVRLVFQQRRCIRSRQRFRKIESLTILALQLGQ
jgi:hypothetical protein